jgi:protein O-GlcNAcase/histone acetyltransferase
VGGFLMLSPEFCMVVEDETGIVGYALTALNVKTYNQKLTISWIAEMQLKYPLQSLNSNMPQNEQESLNKIQKLNFFYNYLQIY